MAQKQDELKQPGPKQPTQQPVKFSRESLLCSKAFSHVQPDFLKAILQKDYYTMEEARTEIDRFFGKER